MDFLYILGLGVFVLVSVLKQINQYEHGVKFTMGRYTGLMEPGWRVIIPVFQSYTKVDLRIHVIDVPDQDAITKDNISVRMNAVVYYKVSDAKMAVLEIRNYEYAISQLAQTTMRDIVGEVELDQLLSNRDELSSRIRKIVDEASDHWGIKIDSVDLKHIELPDDLKRTMGKQAEAEREKRAVIIKAEGEVKASDNLAKAAHVLSGSPGALHLRTLQSLNDLSSDQSNTVVFAVPLEILRAFGSMSKKSE